MNGSFAWRGFPGTQVLAGWVLIRKRGRETEKVDLRQRGLGGWVGIVAVG